ncbi:ABC transporter substrate-binding protein [Geomicrobium sp. JSM 1781026]
MNKFTVRCLVPFAISAVVLSGCITDEDAMTTDPGDDGLGDSNTNEENSEGEDSSDGGTLTIAQGADMVSFDIHDHSNTGTEAIHVNLFSYLVKNDVENGEILPDLATDWELIDDETWEFTLREDATFHNGDSVTAEDVKFTLERVSSDDTLQEYENYRQIEEVEVIDDYTFQIHTNGPQPAMLNRISRLGSGILPKDYIEENDWDHFLREPVGSGPYQFVQWAMDDRVVLERFDDYFEADQAQWDEIVFRSIPESSTRVGEVLAGGVDIAMNIPPMDWDRVESNEGTSIVEGPTNRTMMLVPNHREEFATSDILVREAIDLAIDNQALLDNLMGGSGTPSLTRVNPGNFGVNEALHDDYRFDPEEARAKLEEAGYADGLELTLHSPDGRYLQDRETTEVISGMLSEVGIDVNIDFMEWSSFVDLRAANQQEDLYLIGLSGSLWDAAHQLRHHSSMVAEDHIGYRNDEFDDIYLDAEVNMDEASRQQQYEELQTIADEDLINIMLFQADNFFAVSDRVNFEPRLDELWMVDEITITE